MRRRFGVGAIVGVSGMVVMSACVGGADPGTGDGGVGTSGTSGSGGTSGSSGASGSSGSSGNTGSSGSSGSSGTIADASATDTSTTSCVTGQTILKTIQTAQGECSFKLPAVYQDGLTNVVLTPGWGTVCYAGSSQNCGSGASADGWWYEPSTNEIALCDATCDRFYKQVNAGALTVKFGCASEACTH